MRGLARQSTDVDIEVQTVAIMTKAAVFHAGFMIDVSSVG